ncbi:MAG: T9SS type A sorting domain-containing protein [Flavobacteriales bacterium]
MVRNTGVGLALLALLSGTDTRAQVSAYTFTQEVGTWQSINGSGTSLGMPGLPDWLSLDDKSFVNQGENLPLGDATTGNGWPIGFTFYYNGHAFDRIGLSMEGWLALGNSADGPQAVFAATGAPAYTPLSSAAPAALPSVMRNRIAGFSNDLAPMGGGGTWPIQIRPIGTVPNRAFVAEWNVVLSGTSRVLRFQIRLNEGGGDPAAQTVQVVYGSMTQAGVITGQVGLGGATPADFNNRSVTASPYNWNTSQAGTANTATCRVPSSAPNLPEGLTFTWTPPACAVNGVAITDLRPASGGVSGRLSWLPTTGAGSYSYVITTGAATDTPVLSGNGITATEVQLTGLPAGQRLFAYVRANCAPADLWGAGQPFTTEGTIEVPCGQAPLHSSYCYTDFDHRTWVYTSSSGAPLRAIFNTGSIGSGDLLTCYDGPTDQAPLLFSSATGPVAGQTVNSTGGQLTIRILADQLSSCDNTTWLDPLDWIVGCVDCQPVLANYEVVDDCANGRFSVDVQIFSLGSATSVPITNNGGAAVVTASATGTYTVGPFPNGTRVVVKAENPANLFCTASSDSLSNGACPVVSCGPDHYTYCYANDDAGQWAYRSSDNGRIGIRFLSGTLAANDVLRIYDGLDPFESTPLFVSATTGEDLRGRVVITSADNADHALLMEVAANASGSCATGQATQWEYVVACYTDCTAPAATFSTVPDCSNDRFSVSVALTSLGSASTVQLMNDAGVPAVSATAPGTYTVGPFASSARVVVGVEGDGVLCSIASAPLNGCGLGIADPVRNKFTVHPNPGEGVFRIVPPAGFSERGQLEVLDLTGRVVARRTLQDLNGQGAIQDLSDLPAGSYTLLLNDGTVRWTARVSIQH